MNVIEEFLSIEGEGVRAGRPCTFIRLAGCNLECSYCDTPYSHDFNGGANQTIPQIVDYCKKQGVPCVTVTGGEPLAQAGIKDLIAALAYAGFEVNVETNGSLPIFNVVDPVLYPNVFFTVDYKCPSSGMETMMNKYNYDYMSKHDVLKFVVGTEEDLAAALKVINVLNGKLDKPQIFLSPVWGQIKMSRIVEFMIDNKLNNCKIQVQLHKVIWDPQKRGV